MCQVNDCLAILIYSYLCPLLKIICLQLHEALFRIIAWLLLFFNAICRYFRKSCVFLRNVIYKAELLLLLSLTTYVVRAFYLCEFAGIMR